MKKIFIRKKPSEDIIINILSSNNNIFIDILLIDKINFNTKNKNKS